MIEVLIVPKSTEPCEYWCNGCHQLRLSLVEGKPVQCKNCGCHDLIVGNPGSLDADALRSAVTQ